MKRIELESLIKEVVKYCLKEASTAYKVRDGRTQIERPGLINRARKMQEDPVVNEMNVDDGYNQDINDILDEFDGVLVKYLEQYGIDYNSLKRKNSPLRLDIRSVGRRAYMSGLAKGGKIHKDALFKMAKNENHKVQSRSYRTIDDVPQKPENVRDPNLP
jgi:hypothetical protein